MGATACGRRTSDVLPHARLSNRNVHMLRIHAQVCVLFSLLSLCKFEHVWCHGCFVCIWQMSDMIGLFCFLGGNCATHTTCGDCARSGCQWNNAQNSFCYEQCQSGNCISSVNSNQCSSVVVPGEKSLMILNIMRIERAM